MSYILDALRKAERERERGAVAPLQIVTHGGVPQIAGARNAWPWVLAAVCAALAVAAIVVLIAHRRHAAAPSAPAASTDVAADQEALPPDDAAEIPADEVLPEDETAPIDDEVVSSLDDLADPGPRSARPSQPLKPFDAGQPPRAPGAAAAAAGAASSGVRAQDEVEEPPVDEPVDPMDSEPIEETPEEAAAPDEQTPIEDDTQFGTTDEDVEPPAEPTPAMPSPQVRPAPPPPAQAPRTETVTLEPAPGKTPRPLKELPADFRAAFPRLTVQVHVYDKAAAKRWVIINDRRYREGDTLTEGPRVAEIVQNGIVFDYRGEKVIYPR